MAALQQRGGSFRILFRFAGTQHALPLGRVTPREAGIRLSEAEALLARLQAGLTTLPDGVPVTEFVRLNGHAPAPPTAAPKRLTLGQLRDAYLATHTGSLEANTLGGVKTHFKHFTESWGERFDLTLLGVEQLQAHADRRRQMTTRDGRPVSAVTVKKDFVALRAAWNWAAVSGKLAGPFPPLKAVRLGKAEEKLPFMTLDEAARRLALGADPDRVWECVYLRPPEVADLLEHVRTRPHAPPWLHPMACVAAYTGARRSELLRLEAADVDLGGMEVTLRERKRVKGQKTTRRVPVTAALAGVLRGWLAVRPEDTPALFAQSGELPQSRKRGRGKRAGTTPVTKDEASDHLDRALLAGGKWRHLRGWHVLRHSFVSACASKGVDQRLISEWVGHTTAEQERRYRHLFPDVQRRAIEGVFG